MKMAPVEGGLVIKPGETVTLKPGGYHLMFMDLKDALKKGETVMGALTFAKAGSVPVTFTVESIRREGTGSGHDEDGPRQHGARWWPHALSAFRPPGSGVRTGCWRLRARSRRHRRRHGRAPAGPRVEGRCSRRGRGSVPPAGLHRRHPRLRHPRRMTVHHGLRLHTLSEPLPDDAGRTYRPDRRTARLRARHPRNLRQRRSLAGHAGGDRRGRAGLSCRRAACAFARGRRHDRAHRVRRPDGRARTVRGCVRSGRGARGGAGGDLSDSSLRRMSVRRSAARLIRHRRLA